MEKAYKYLGYFLFLLIPLTFLGFYNTYFKQFPDFAENIDTFIHLHAIIASAWIVMLIVQPVFIANRKNNLHKQVGKVSYLVFPLLILSFIPQMIKIMNSEYPTFLFFPAADSILLILFYTLAIFYKKDKSKHMRYMIGTAIVFLGPTFGRIGPIILGLPNSISQNILYTIIYIILIGLILYDRQKGKNFRPYLLILATWITHQISFNLIF